MPKPSIAVVMTRLPFPRDSGVAHKNYHLISALRRDYLVDLVIIDRRRIDEEDLESTRELVRSVIYLRQSVFEVCIEILRCIFTMTPIQCAFFNSNRLRSVLKKMADRADLLVGSVGRTWPSLKRFDGPIIMDLGDCLTKQCENNAQNAKTLRLRAFFLLESWLMPRIEKQIVRRSAYSYVFNPNEANWLSNFSPSVRCVPHGVVTYGADSRNNCDEGPLRSEVVIFGRMDFLPNVDAVEWFLEKVVPLLPTDMRLIAMGAAPKSRLLEMAEKNARLVVTGFVDRPDRILKGAIASLAPVRLGGGIQNKVIESLALGVPVLVSPQVMQSLPNFASSGARVCASPQEWADQICELSENPSLRLSTKKAGQSYVDRNFSWHKYMEILRQDVRDVLCGLDLK